MRVPIVRRGDGERSGKAVQAASVSASVAHVTARFTARLTARPIARAQALGDCVFLVAVAAISLVPYVDRLGFYQDDYPLLGNMEASGGSILDRYHAVRPALGQRSLAALMFAVLDWVFGPNALGWHVVNGILIVAVAVLLYLILRELRLPRLVAVSLPLVYSTLPHYATERFWPDVIGVNLGNACYLLSLYAALRAVRSSRLPLIAWLVLAAISFTVMVFTYEIFVPLVVVSLVLVWFAAPEAAGRHVARRSALPPSAVLLGTVIATTGMRAAGVAEHGQNGYEFGFQNGFAHHLAYLVSGAIKLNLGTYLLALPYVLWWIMRHEFDVTNAAVAAVTGLLSFVYVLRVGRAHGAPKSSGIWRALLVAGLVTFVLGYSVFLTTESILFRSAGLDNRTNVAAAFGIAAMMIGGAGWLTGRMSVRGGTIAFAVIAACAVASGVLVIETLGSFWARAAEQQDKIVTSLMQTAGTLPASSTVILDGSCPEIGPAVVFASEWDFRGALQLAYDDPLLKADVAYENLEATPRGLLVEVRPLDTVLRRTYPYARNLFVFDYSRRQLHNVPDRSSAVRYVAHFRPAFHCPPLRGFAWGFDPSRRFSLP
jgi:hypothetical protein